MFELPALPYDFAALEPHIDAKTMEIHHDKHHATYVKNLNDALQGHEAWQHRSIEDILQHLDELPDDIRTKVQNNGGGHYNHSLFWTSLSPNKSEPSAELLETINKQFSNLDGLKEQLAATATGRFGSGWAWLCMEGDKLEICSTANQDSPLSQGHAPLLGVDVWEHAYYLHYQNRRPDYLAAWWNVVNWDEVSRRYTAAKGI